MNYKIKLTENLAKYNIELVFNDVFLPVLDNEPAINFKLKCFISNFTGATYGLVDNNILIYNNSYITLNNRKFLVKFEQNYLKLKEI